MFWQSLTFTFLCIKCTFKDAQSNDHEYSTVVKTEGLFSTPEIAFVDADGKIVKIEHNDANDEFEQESEDAMNVEEVATTDYDDKEGENNACEYKNLYECDDDIKTARQTIVTI